MPEVWVPGEGAPSPQDFVERLHGLIEQHGENAVVTLELRDGSRFDLISISPEPGYGFIAVRPHPEDEAPAEVVLPVAAIAQISIHAPEEKAKVGFSLPEPKKKPR